MDMRNFFRTIGILWFGGVFAFGAWGTYAYHNPESAFGEPSESTVATVMGLASVDADADFGDQWDQFQDGRERGKNLLDEVERTREQAKDEIAKVKARKQYGDDWGDGALDTDAANGGWGE